MAGPTPVSALIHAATMVTAGLYMVTRTNVIFQHSQTMMLVVAVVGALTALFAATIGITQNDIKKVLAYSTVSQLGFMFLACGVGAFVIGIFHVMTHAFFKALMFLGAGSVIHGMHHEQDMRRMGGLRKYMPKTYLTFMAGWLAICGIIPFSGFWSKDEILWNAASTTYIPGGWLLWLLATIAATCTAFYMTRLMAMTFWGKERFLEVRAGGQADEAHAAAYDEGEELHAAIDPSVADRPHHGPEERVGVAHVLETEAVGDAEGVDARGHDIHDHHDPHEDEAHGARARRTWPRARRPRAPARLRHPARVAALDVGAAGRARRAGGRRRTRRHRPGLQVPHGHGAPRRQAQHRELARPRHLEPRDEGVRQRARRRGEHAEGWRRQQAADARAHRFEFAAGDGRGRARTGGARRADATRRGARPGTATTRCLTATPASTSRTRSSTRSTRTRRRSGSSSSSRSSSRDSACCSAFCSTCGGRTCPACGPRGSAALYRASYNKYWVDELYGALVTRRTMDAARGVYQIDSKVVDGAVNGAASLTRQASTLTGDVDRLVVDGAVNGLAGFVKLLVSPLFRAAQTGLTANYALVMVLGLVATVALYFGKDILAALTGNR